MPLRPPLRSAPARAAGRSRRRPGAAQGAGVRAQRFRSRSRTIVATALMSREPRQPTRLLKKNMAPGYPSAGPAHLRKRTDRRRPDDLRLPRPDPAPAADRLCEADHAPGCHDRNRPAVFSANSA
ncbi:hypothetical protein GCM10010335_46830 [Streptomyces galbus]|nr:hypothetical protein GCM10010335_46830 [Streptomyces galbus]